MMEIYNGKSITNRIAIGPVFYCPRRRYVISKDRVVNVPAELRRFSTALQSAKKQLSILIDKSRAEHMEESARIFEVHYMLLEDHVFCNNVEKHIETKQVSAEYAVQMTQESLVDLFHAMDDEYMRARAADIKEVAERVNFILCGEGAEHSEIVDLNRPSILVAEELTAGDLIQLPREYILGVVTREGALTSHLSIMARTLNVPALIGVDVQEAWHEKTAIVDGVSGQVMIDPDESQLGKASEMLLEYEKQNDLLAVMRGLETVTRSGERVSLYANIGSVVDAGTVLEQDGEGVGLFRSEFLFLERTILPSEEELYMTYRQLAERMEGRTVIIRTLDQGEDKQVSYLQGINPKQLIRLQLRALKLASEKLPDNKIKVLFPMIRSLREVEEIRELMYQEQCNLPLGIMIETPEAVRVVEQLAGMVDFFSIGTNDLTRYTFGIDRRDETLDYTFEANKAEIMRMIERTIRAGHEAGIFVEICGNLAADQRLTEEFVRMGVDALSMPPTEILGMRKLIRELKL